LERLDGRLALVPVLISTSRYVLDRYLSVSWRGGRRVHICFLNIGHGSEGLGLTSSDGGLGGMEPVPLFTPLFDAGPSLQVP
jgi:hypothetical protein